MANENQVVLEIVLDDGSVVKGFAKIKNEAKKTGEESAKELSTIGDALNFRATDVFLNKLKSIPIGFAAAAAAGVAAGFALKQAFDLALQGEKIDKINNQFEVLASRAGFAADKLRNELVGATRGLADDEEIIKIANVALAELGSTAEKLPQLLDVARQASARFGGSLEDNFELINRAILSTNTRQLKSINLFVDAEAAIKKYAAENGRTANEVTQLGKQQALLNAVLDAGQKSSVGLDESNSKLTKSSKQLSVSIGEIGDSLAKISQAAFGDVFSSLANGLNSVARAISGVGPGIKTQVQEIDDRLASLNKSLIARQEALRLNAQAIQDEASGKRGIVDSLLFGTVDPAFIQSKIDGIQKSISDLTARRDALQKALAPQEDGSTFSNEERQKEALQNQEKFQAELLRIQQESQASFFDVQLAGATLQEQQNIAMQEAEFAQLQAMNKIREDFAGVRGISEAQYQEIEAQQLTNHKLKIQKIEADFSAKIVENEKKQQTARLQGLSTFFGGLGSLMQSSTKELFEIGKVGAIAQATVDGYLAIQNALANVPYPFNIAAATGIGIATAANIAKITSTEFGGGGALQASTPNIIGGGGTDLSNPLGPENLERQAPGTAVIVNFEGANILGDESAGKRIVELINGAFDTSGVEVRQGITS